MPRAQYIPRTCENCGEPFASKPSVIAKGGGKYCSRRCFDLGRLAQTVDRFWSKVNKDGPIPPHNPTLGPCWPWTALTRGHGYGKYDVGGKAVIAHRYSYELAHGPIGAGVLLRHDCDTPACVNPAHLTPGTTQDNIADKVTRGRVQSGTTCYNAKLDEAAVRDIRQRHAEGSATKLGLARQYGVSRWLIGLVLQRKSWAHIA